MRILSILLMAFGAVPGTAIAQGELRSPRILTPIFPEQRGIALLCGSGWDRAICDFTESLRLNVNQPEVYALRGLARFNRPTPDYDRAVDDLDLALLLNPKLAYVYHWRAQAANGKWCARKIAEYMNKLSAATKTEGRDTDAASLARLILSTAEKDAEGKKEKADLWKVHADLALAEFAESQGQLATANQSVTRAVANGKPSSFQQAKDIRAHLKDADGE